MHVLRYEIHNILRISDLTLDMEGRHLFLIGGRNGEGKTSAIHALLMALCGRRGLDDYPAPALKEGEDEGWVSVRLSGSSKLLEDQHITVELYLVRGRDGAVAEKFRILDSSGEEAPSPRTLLRDLYKTRGFDPLHFDRQDRKQQRETLMEIVGLDLEGYLKQHDQLYSERTLVNRNLKTAKSQLAAMPTFPDAPEQEINVAHWMDELDRLRDHNAKFDQLENTVDRSQGDYVDSVERCKTLEKELEKAVLERDRREEVLKKARQLRDEHGPRLETTKARDQIKGADELNEMVRANLAHADADAKVKELDKESKELTRKLKDLDKKQDKRMKEANWPVDGLGVDKEGVLFDGLPYEQACASDRIRISTKIGMAANPELRLLVSEHGNDLDLDALKVLEDELKDGDFQMLLEFVTRNAEDEDLCAVVIEDGEAKTARI